MLHSWWVCVNWLTVEWFCLLFYTTCHKSDQTPNLLLSELSPISWAALHRADKFPCAAAICKHLEKLFTPYLHFSKFSGCFLFFLEWRHAGAFKASSIFEKLFISVGPQFRSKLKYHTFTAPAGWIPSTQVISRLFLLKQLQVKVFTHLVKYFGVYWTEGPNIWYKHSRFQENLSSVHIHPFKYLKK